MVIDCERCTMRDIACADCVVTHFLATPAVDTPGLRPGEERALAVLHGAGLVPPLRMAEGPGRSATG